MLRVALTVTITSPLVPTVPVVDVTAKGDALYVFILPVVGLPEGSVTTCNSPETNQFWLITWSVSAETTSRLKLCGFPSVSNGTKGVTSRKYVGRSSAP